MLKSLAFNFIKKREKETQAKFISNQSQKF